MAPKLPRAHRVQKEGSQYRVMGVPIFAEHTRTFSCPKTGKQYKVTVDRERLEKFAANGNKRAREDSYLAAIHPVHNGEQGADSSSCGLMENYRVETFEFEGKPQAVLTVDLIARDKAELETIKRHPYRSPETNLEKNEIGTLALLERQAPFFKFPLFKTHDSDASAIYRAENTNQPEAAGVAFAAYRDATQYAPLYQWNLNYGEAEVKDKEKPKGDKASCKSADKPEEKKDAARPDLMERLAKFLDYMEADDDDEDEKAKKKADEPAALLSQEELQSYADDRELLIATAERCDALYGEVSELRGQLAGIKTENAALKARNEASDLVNWAVAETEGLVRPANFTDEVKAIYRDDGISAAKRFVKGLMLGAPEREDYQDNDRDDASLDAGLPEEVEKYSDDPVKFERAKAAYQMYRDGGDMARRRLGSLDSYLDLEINGYGARN